MSGLQVLDTLQAAAKKNPQKAAIPSCTSDGEFCKVESNVRERELIKGCKEAEADWTEAVHVCECVIPLSRRRNTHTPFSFPLREASAAV